MNKAYCSCFATPLFKRTFVCSNDDGFQLSKERRCKSSLQRLPFI